MARGPEEAVVPTGRHGLAPDVVASQQRDRLFAATVELVAERGYRNTSIEHIVKAARVGYAAFYELYEGKEECFLAAFDRIVEETAAELALAVAGGADWPRRMAAALACLIDIVVAEPRRARVALVEVQAAGPAGYARYEAAVGLAVPKLRQGRADGGEAAGLAESLEQAVLGGVIWIVHQHLVGGKPEEAESLLDQAIQIALAPYLGEAEARDVATTTRRERSG